MLNRAVGGINPQAVEQQATVKGKFLKVVFMPTVDAEKPADAQRKPALCAHSQGWGAAAWMTVEVLKLIVKYDLVLATGHLQPGG